MGTEPRRPPRVHTLHLDLPSSGLSPLLPAFSLGVHVWLLPVGLALWEHIFLPLPPALPPYTRSLAPPMWSVDC